MSQKLFWVSVMRAIHNWTVLLLMAFGGPPFGFVYYALTLYIPIKIWEVSANLANLKTTNQKD
jgi:hypothetical protein